MSFDLLIRGGTIIDGSGRPGFPGDIAVKDGKIVAIGTIEGQAKQLIDAKGLVVSPGFIDPHTHYDAQMSWDSLVTPTSWHGITTTVIGNCGVGLAPCKPEFRTHALWDLINVEAMSKEVLEAGIEWQWESFGDYINATVKRGSAINLGFLVPLSPLRTYVLGAEAAERVGTAKEIQLICGLLDEAMQAGALGFSSSQQPNHVGFEGKPLASRLTSNDEFAAYAGTLRKQGKGAIEIAVTKQLATLADDEVELLDMLARESERPVTWLTLLDLNSNPGIARKSIDKTEHLISRQVHPQTIVRPFLVEVDIHNPFVFAPFPAWKPAFNQTAETQKGLYSAPAFRAQFKEDIKSPKSTVRDWNHYEVLEVTNPELRSLVGKTIAEIAEETASHPCDAFLDIAIADNIETRFRVAAANSTEENLIELITDERTRIGLGDGGAHVDMLCEAGYTTYLLGYWVRERNIMSLERAVQRITSESAALFDLKKRGALKIGYAADICIFDPKTIGSDRRPHLIHDLPAGGKRMIAKARGVEYTIVNGEVVFDHGVHTGALPGQAVN